MSRKCCYNCDKMLEQCPELFQGRVTSVENTTRLVGFAGATVLDTSTGRNVGVVTTPYSFNISSVVAQGNPGNAGNDNRQYLITFSEPHPNGANYIITVAKPSNEPNGDERKIQFTNKTPTSFVLKQSIDDNGANEDQQVWSSFDFVVHVEETIITNIILT